MAYQRWEKPGRFYIWASNQGLHIWPPSSPAQHNLLVTRDAAGRDNAEAFMRGCFDHLASLGVSVSVKKGRIEFSRKEPK